jgi:hypothetical protein
MFFTANLDSDKYNETSEKVISYAKRLAGDNNFFTKGSHVVVVKGFYVSLEKDNNTIYGPDSKLLDGKNVSNVEAILISADEKISDEKRIQRIDINDVLTIDHDVILLFTPRKIYVLNFNTKNFGYYERHTAPDVK